MKKDKLPFQIGKHYENWEFDLEVLNFERVKWLDSFQYVKSVMALGEQTKYVEMIFCWDILVVVILVFEEIKDFNNNFLISKKVKIKILHLNDSTYLIYGKEKHLEQIINSLINNKL